MLNCHGSRRPPTVAQSTNEQGGQGRVDHKNALPNNPNPTTTKNDTLLSLENIYIPSVYLPYVFPVSTTEISDHTRWGAKRLFRFPTSRRMSLLAIAVRVQKLLSSNSFDWLVRHENQHLAGTGSQDHARRI